MHGDWSPPALRAALAAIQDAGYDQGEIAGLAAVNRSQVNRWARGENRPTYDKALRLARRMARRRADLAARLMTAAGYSWDGQPEPETERADVLADRFGPEDADRMKKVFLARPDGEAILREMEKEFRPPGEEGGSRPESAAG